MRTIQTLISLVILALLCLTVDVPLVARTVLSARLAPLGLGLAILLSGTLVRAWRWRIIVSDDDDPVGYLDAVLVAFVGGALNLLLPATAGDIAKAGYAFRRTGVRERSVSGSLIDKLIALLAAGLLGVIPSLVYRLWDLAAMNLIVAAAASALVYFPGVLPWHSLTALLARVRIQVDVKALRRGARLSLQQHGLCLTLSLVGWAMTFVAAYFMFVAVSASEISLGEVFVAAPLVTVARLFPFTLDGLGTAEAAAVYLYGRAGVAPETALSGQVLSRLIGSYLVGLIGAFIMLLTRPRRPPAKDREPH